MCQLCKKVSIFSRNIKISELSGYEDCVMAMLPFLCSVLLSLALYLQGKIFQKISKYLCCSLLQGDSILKIILIKNEINWIEEI